jgi:uncharacterized RDD family membrane protein YckC
MICPHCAFPNENGAHVCRKCKRPLGNDLPIKPAPGDERSRPTSPPATPQVFSGRPEELMSDDLPTPSEEIRPPAGGQPTDILEKVSNCLADARKKQESGDLRGAFLVCQSLLIDMYGDIPKEALASLYGYMAKVSKLQGKSERAQKYMRKADSLTGKQPAKHRVAPPSSIEKAISRAVDDAAAMQEDLAPEKSQEPQPQPEPEPAEQPALSPKDDALSAIPVGNGRAVMVAGFWARLAAFVLDSLIVGAVVIIMMVMSSLLQGDGADGAFLFFAQKISLIVVAILIYIGFLLVYLTLFSSYGGQSAGKMLLRIRVIQLDGHSLSGARALRRAGGMLVAALPGLAGFFWAAFDLKRRGWHDYIGGTLVVQLAPHGPSAQTRT